MPRVVCTQELSYTRRLTRLCNDASGPCRAGTVVLMEGPWPARAESGQQVPLRPASDRSAARPGEIATIPCDPRDTLTTRPPAYATAAPS